MRPGRVRSAVVVAEEAVATVIAEAVAGVVAMVTAAVAEVTAAEEEDTEVEAAEAEGTAGAAADTVTAGADTASTVADTDIDLALKIARRCILGHKKQTIPRLLGLARRADFDMLRDFPSPATAPGSMAHGLGNAEEALADIHEARQGHRRLMRGWWLW
jgi:hypothetical protein